jgi:type II secretory pathway component PulM
MPILPKSGTLTNGQSLQFSLVDATGAAVAVAGGASLTWSVTPTVGSGSIDNNGLYTAPATIGAPTAVTINGVLSGGPSPETASVPIQLVPPEVILTPTKADLRAGEVQQFSATVPGDAANTVQWNIAPSLGNMLNGRYTAPAEIVEDREVLVTATSVIDPHKSSTATLRLRGKPLAIHWTVALMAYLVLVYCLVGALVILWPPALPESSVVDKARTAHGAAVAAADKAREEAKNAAAALAQTKQNPPDPALKKAAEDADEAKKKAEQVESDNLQAQKDLEDPPVPTKYFGKISREIDLLLLVLITGAIGSFVHSARSFVDFVGNKAIRGSWGAWYLMYPLIGSALALIFYLAVRGGFLTTSTTGANMNTFGLVAISGMVGMFSKQATNKLDELFSTLFQSNKGQALKDQLNTTQTAAQAKPQPQTPPTENKT